MKDGLECEELYQREVENFLLAGRDANDHDNVMAATLLRHAGKIEIADLLVRGVIAANRVSDNDQVEDLSFIVN